jgi:alcohol dehydrogenase
MRSYRLDDFGSLDHLQIHEEPSPQPQRGEVLVRVRAVSLNFRDLAMARDEYPVPHRKGLVPTSDAAGEVAAIGAGVDAFAVGDRVMSTFHPRWFAGPMPVGVHAHAYGAQQDGWLTEEKVVSQEALVRIPDELSLEEAATLPCAAVTAWTALTVGMTPVHPGKTVLTQGTGGVSIFAVQLAKALGGTVIATTSSAAKAERLRALGAAHVINYAEEVDWGETARALTNGRGVDRVVEVGGSETMPQSLRAVRESGDVVAIGFLASKQPNVNFFALFGSRATFRPISVGSRADLEAVAAVFAGGDIRPVVDRVFAFDKARDAFAHLATGQHFGKVVIRI